MRFSNPSLPTKASQVEPPGGGLNEGSKETLEQEKELAGGSERWGLLVVGLNAAQWPCKTWMSTSGSTGGRHIWEHWWAALQLPYVIG